MRQVIRDNLGKELGSITEEASGRKIARNFLGKELGTYDPSDNTTRDFYGRVLARGDITSGLVWQDKDNW